MDRKQANKALHEHAGNFPQWGRWARRQPEFVKEKWLDHLDTVDFEAFVAASKRFYQDASHDSILFQSHISVVIASAKARTRRMNSEIQKRDRAHTIRHEVWRMNRKLDEAAKNQLVREALKKEQLERYEQEVVEAA